VRTPLLALLVVAAGCREPPPMLAVMSSPPVVLPSAAELVRACAFEVSCFHDPAAATLNNCIGYLTVGLEGLPDLFTPPSLETADFRRYIDCANRNQDCTDVLDCVTLGHGSAWCAAHPGTTCDGDVLVPCSTATPADAALFTVDCAARGMHCAVANGGASCSDGVSCDPRAEMPYCDGNRYYQYCDSTTRLRYRFDCARSTIPNATCRGSKGCVPSGPPCSANRCDGDVLVSCIVGQEVPLDCSQRASHCVDVMGNPTCVPIATECDDGKNVDACNNDALTTCLDGTLQSIACSAIGLSTCSLTPGLNPICG
jgi:hypothetical protein